MLARDVRERKGGSLAVDTDKEEKKARAVSAPLLIPPEIQIREKCFPIVLTTDGFIIKVVLIKINFSCSYNDDFNPIEHSAVMAVMTSVLF